MRVIMTGGGTGGHIYPAIAIADKIKTEQPDAEILYVGNEIGLEKDIVPKAGYEMAFVSAKWIDRSNPLKILDTGFATLRGVWQAGNLMKRFRPDVVIGTGGYVCFPVIYAAHRYGARCYLHEQNAFPGVANKSLERYVDKVFLGFPEASGLFHHPEKHVVTGNPVRRDFYGVDKAAARERLGIGQNDFVIFSFGGSQGAEAINNVVFDLMREVNGTQGITLLFGTGGYYYEDILARCKEQGIDPAENVRIKLYIDDMPDHLAASDLIIARAGALSVAEICVSGRASILVPSPNVTGNHQYFNAKSVADRGGAILIEEKEFTSNRLNREVAALRDDPDRLRSMEEASRSCVPGDATEVIYRNLQR